MKVTTVLVLALSLGVNCVPNITTKVVFDSTTKDPTTLSPSIPFKTPQAPCCSPIWVQCLSRLQKIENEGAVRMIKAGKAGARVIKTTDVCGKLKFWMSCLNARLKICAQVKVSSIKTKVATVNEAYNCSLEITVDHLETTTTPAEAETSTVGVVTTQKITTTTDYLPPLPSFECDQQNLDRCIFVLKSLLKKQPSNIKKRALYYRDKFGICKALENFKKCAAKSLLYCETDPYETLEKLYSKVNDTHGCKQDFPWSFYKEPRKLSAECIRNVFADCVKPHGKFLEHQYKINDLDAEKACRFGKWRTDCLGAGLKRCNDIGGDIGDDVLDAIQNKCNKDDEQPTVSLSGGASRCSFLRPTILLAFMVLTSIVCLMF